MFWVFAETFQTDLLISHLSKRENHRNKYKQALGQIHFNCSNIHLFQLKMKSSLWRAKQHETYRTFVLFYPERSLVVLDIELYFHFISREVYFTSWTGAQRRLKSQHKMCLLGMGLSTSSINQFGFQNSQSDSTPRYEENQKREPFAKQILFNILCLCVNVENVVGHCHWKTRIAHVSRLHPGIEHFRGMCLLWVHTWKRSRCN